jgi:hypothetical protein
MRYNFIKIDEVKKEMKKEVEKVIGCNCAGATEDLHTCPFKTEIHDDHETLCDCCDYCQEQCRYEI